VECKWTAHSLFRGLPEIEELCRALVSCTVFLAGWMTAARRRDRVSLQSKPLPARHELSSLFFQPRSVDLDLALRSYSPTEALRTFAPARFI
jgi:hypothetical protein